jgi:hypothetical protein
MAATHVDSRRLSFLVALQTHHGCVRLFKRLDYESVNWSDKIQDVSLDQCMAVLLTCSCLE